MNKTQTICPKCLAIISGRRQSSQSLEAALKVHEDSCPGLGRIKKS
jgi:hypothetical protein